ncbi:hypothetical protein [Rhodoferax sp.]|nr:hypothetical protein [Rhodoferax sp.]
MLVKPAQPLKNQQKLQKLLDRQKSKRLLQSVLAKQQPRQK